MKKRDGFAGILIGLGVVLVAVVMAGAAGWLHWRAHARLTSMTAVFNGVAPPYAPSQDELKIACQELQPCGSGAAYLHKLCRRARYACFDAEGGGLYLMCTQSRGGVYFDPGFGSSPGRAIEIMELTRDGRCVRSFLFRDGVDAASKGFAALLGEDGDVSRLKALFEPESSRSTQPAK